VLGPLPGVEGEKDLDELVFHPLVGARATFVAQNVSGGRWEEDDHGTVVAGVSPA
jgi:hypothetical protein